MEKHIMGENGISYTLGEDGLYYPDLYLPEETEYPIGKYGMLRKTYLQEHRKGLYLELVLSGNEYYGSNVPLFRRNGYRQSGTMIP